MTKYQILLAAQQSGLMKLLASEFGFPTHYVKWLDIYTCHLEHPTLSQERIGYKFNISQSVVSDVYAFMRQDFTDVDIFSSVVADWMSRLFVVISQSNSERCPNGQTGAPESPQASYSGVAPSLSKACASHNN